MVQGYWLQWQTDIPNGRLEAHYYLTVQTGIHRTVCGIEIEDTAQLADKGTPDCAECAKWFDTCRTDSFIHSKVYYCDRGGHSRIVMPFEAFTHSKLPTCPICGMRMLTGRFTQRR